MNPNEYEELKKAFVELAKQARLVVEPLAVIMKRGLYEIMSDPKEIDRVARKERHRARYYRMMARMRGNK